MIWMTTQTGQVTLNGRTENVSLQEVRFDEERRQWVKREQTALDAWNERFGLWQVITADEARALMGVSYVAPPAAAAPTKRRAS